MPEPSLETTPLDWQTRTGLFVADGGVSLWVIDSFSRRYAVSLNLASPWPQFTAFERTSTALATGAWLGPLRLRVGALGDEGYRFRCGVIGQTGLRYFLKALDEDGDPIRILLPDYDRGLPSRYTTLSADWQLMLCVGNRETCVFRSAPNPPSFGRWSTRSANRAPVRHVAHEPPRIVWSAPTVDDRESDGDR